MLVFPSSHHLVCLVLDYTGLASINYLSLA